MECKDTTRIINAENIEQLQKIRDEELAKVRKLRLVIKELVHLDCDKMTVPDKEQIQNAINIIKIGDFLYISEKKDHCLLDFEVPCKVNLNYTERKAVRHQLSLNLHNNLQRVQQFGAKLHDELPELFEGSNCPHNEIINLELQKRSNLEKLAQIRNRKCHVLKAAAELKMGPYLGFELDIDYVKARQNQTKVNVLKGYFVNELLTRTDHSLKAIREVETCINESLEKEMDGSN